MKSVLLKVSKEERELIERFASDNDLSIKDAISYLVKIIVNPQYKPNHLINNSDSNIQCRLDKSIHSKLKKKSSELGVSMKDLLIDALKSVSK